MIIVAYLSYITLTLKQFLLIYYNYSEKGVEMREQRIKKD